MSNTINFLEEITSKITSNKQDLPILMFKNGGKTKDNTKPKIHIKKSNEGKFTSYCGGKVTDECINKAKQSGNPKLVKRATFAANARKWKHKEGGLLIKNQFGGNTNDYRYNNVISIYNSLLDEGIQPQAALELTNQKVAEKGWKGYVSGDNKHFNNSDDFAEHLINLHQRLYPDSLKANNFNQFYKAIEFGKNKYNPNPNAYKQQLLDTRNGVKKRINSYRAIQNLPPLTLLNNINNNNV